MIGDLIKYMALIGIGYILCIAIHHKTANGAYNPTLTVQKDYSDCDWQDVGVLKKVDTKEIERFM